MPANVAMLEAFSAAVASLASFVFLENQDDMPFFPGAMASVSTVGAGPL